MSGGSYSYAHSKIQEEIRHWASMLEDMSEHCRRYAVDTPTKNVRKSIQNPNRDPKWGPEHEDVPLTLEDRARILVKSLVLQEIATKIREVERLLTDEVCEIMHDVEWVESGDYRPDQLIGEGRRK